MINVSKLFRQKLYEGNNQFLIRLEITLQDNTKLTVENDNIMSNNGILIDDAVSEDDDFTALGSTIINACDVVLYNNANLYSDYEFINAKAVAYIGLDLDGIVEEIKKGTYTVDDAVYGESTITLTLVDEMAQFDKPYSLSNLSYPATLSSIVLNACSICNVPLASNSLRFPHNDFSVATKPSEESTTFREVLGWVATIAGCFARCNVDGELELKWFDINALDSEQEATYDGGTFSPWSTGNTIDGGTFNPWSTGNTVDGGEFTDSHAVHYISSLYSQSLGVDDVVITGVKIIVEIEDTTSDEDTKEFTRGTDDYLIEISDNKFITVDNASTILNWLATALIGTRFRKCNIRHLTDPTIEAGDVALLWDTKDVEHKILITRADFSPTGLQTVISGAASVGRNSATRFSNQTKSYAATRRQLRNQQDTYEQALAQLAERIDNADGLYETDVEQEDGSIIKYYHNKPELEESDIQIVISSVGITVTSNGTATTPTWYGLTVDGNLITSILNTVGINADWINTGSIADDTGKNYWNLNTGAMAFSGSFELTGGNSLTKIKQISYDVWRINVAGSAYAQKIARTNVYGFCIQAGTTDIPSSYIAMRPGTNPEFVMSGNNPKRCMIHTSGYSVEDEIETTRKAYNIHFIDTSTERRLASLSIGESDIDIYCGQSGITESDAPYIILSDTYFGIRGNGKELQHRSGLSYLYWGGQALEFHSSSSKRYKENIEEINDEILNPHRLYDLTIKQFKYKDGVKLQYADMKNKNLPGFIAEEVAKVYPSATIYNDNGEIESWDERRIIPPMLKLIQEQKQKIDELEERITKLENIISKLI